MRTLVFRRVAILGLLALVLSLASVPVVRSAPPVSAAPAVPYTDPASDGYIGLCNQQGQQITSGSVSAAPFVWRAVSSQPAPAPYNGAGGTAILTAYLPMQGLPPGDWSGEQLTASSRYSNPQVPMAQATAKDVPLQDFLEDYPPEWDGFIQLRLFLGAQDQPAYVQRYPALNLEISGNAWTAVALHFHDHQSLRAGGQTKRSNDDDSGPRDIGREKARSIIGRHQNR
jgi:hypothetical protein